MTVYFRTAVLCAALALTLAAVSCTGTATAPFQPEAKDLAAKPAKPTAVANVYPAEASAPVLAHYTADGSAAAGDAEIVKWEWKFSGGWEDHSATSGEVWKTYTTLGTKVAHLRV